MTDEDLEQADTRVLGRLSPIVRRNQQSWPDDW